MSIWGYARDIDMQRFPMSMAIFRSTVNRNVRVRFKQNTICRDSYLRAHIDIVLEQESIDCSLSARPPGEFVTLKRFPTPFTSHPPSAPGSLRTHRDHRSGSSSPRTHCPGPGDDAELKQQGPGDDCRALCLPSPSFTNRRSSSLRVST